MIISQLCCGPIRIKAAPHEQQHHDVQRSVVSLLRNQNNIETTVA